MQYLSIQSQAELAQFLARHGQPARIAFDTEFVSEHTYDPELCLIQVWVDGETAVIDPYPVGNLDAFWHWLVEPHHETIVHAGREELLFCLRATDRIPANLLDVQIGAGLMGLEYPAGYANLVSRLTGQMPYKGETRTDWRKRPLTPNQLRYAIEDVLHLSQMRDAIEGRLTQLGRLPWWREEMSTWSAEIALSLAEKANRRVPRASGMNAKAMAVARELSLWREAEARKRNRPARQILRDDLLVELSKRQSADPARIRSIRGMERKNFQDLVPQLATAIAKALAQPEQQVPSHKVDNFSQLNLLGQFLGTALGSICKVAEIAPSLVGTATDVRELAAYHLGLMRGDEPPVLARGWRAEIVGKQIEELLAGQMVLRIVEPLGEHPLRLESRGQG